MSAIGNLDLRYPIGGLFVVLGLILFGYGLATGGNSEMYVRSSSVNINLWWGAVMLFFGFVFLALASRGAAAHRASAARDVSAKSQG